MGSGPKFFQTRMGMRFYETELPRLVRAAERVATALEAIAAASAPQKGSVHSDEDAALEALKRAVAADRNVIREIADAKAAGVSNEKIDNALKPKPASEPTVHHGVARQIHQLMDGLEWTPDTLDQIAAVLEAAGFKIEEAP